ncbi:MAG: hypothetical protein J0L64_08450 [Acidobacteria bacterium]|nr:hypothetical protein [Acidobacteriota bacterium]
MLSNARLWGTLCLAALIVCLRCRAEDLTALRALQVYATAQPPHADLTFTEPLAPNSAPLFTLASATAQGEWNPLGITAMQGLGGRPRMLRVYYAEPLPAEHTRLRACTESGACVEARIDSPSDAAAAILKKLGALPATQQDKSLLASLFFGRAAGLNVGAADLNLVRSDPGAKDLSYFLRLKRGAASGMDPRHVEAGAHWRRNFLLNSDRRAAIATALRGRPAEAQALLDELQTKWWAGHTLDIGVKVEGDASGQQQWIGLVDAGWGLQSTTRRVALPGAPGWLRFRWLAGGVEAGRDQARLKMGADAALVIQAREETAPIRRFEFVAHSTARWLARPELGARGLRPWTQLDAKLFVLESASLRYGLRLSLQHGSLPPLYERVNSIHLGFVVESRDTGE